MLGRDWQIPESDLEGLPRGRKRGRPRKTQVEQENAAKPKARLVKKESDQ